MKWSLYSGDKYLGPLSFSNGKSQLEVVKETVEAIKEGHKIIFIKGVCGTGKSAIALHIAKELGRASVVVPVKALQKQYEKDYTNKLQILKDNKEKLKINVITGRANHKCIYKGDCNADNKLLPCDIELSKNNLPLIKKYIKENSFVEEKNFRELKDVKRKSIAPACPYWSPIVDMSWFNEDSYLQDAEELNYKGLRNKTFTYNKRKQGCTYYGQFLSYITSDVIIFNSKKYELENVMDRKPATDVEIIDECDEFLDNLSNEKKINLNRLSGALVNLKTKDLDIKELSIEINDLVDAIIKNKKTKEVIESKEISLIKETKILGLLKSFLSNPSLVNLEEDESDHLYNIYQTAKTFENFFDETYVTFNRDDFGNMIVNLITINLEKRLNEFVDKNKVFVMMSGTLHSETVLEKIFGIKNFKIIEAETNHRGKISIVRSGLEKNFNYNELQLDGSREKYLKALSKSIELAEKPVFVNVNSFSDLPSEKEIIKYNFTNLKSREKLRQEQGEFKEGELVQKFKDKQIDILYSTTCNRGIDFPGDICNSIVFTKYPYPNVGGLFWRVLKKSKPNHYNDFYRDKARREYLQRIYRGLRSHEDKINILSPDLRVFNGK